MGCNATPAPPPACWRRPCWRARRRTRGWGQTGPGWWGSAAPGSAGWATAAACKTLQGVMRQASRQAGGLVGEASSTGQQRLGIWARRPGLTIWLAVGGASRTSATAAATSSCSRLAQVAAALLHACLRNRSSQAAAANKDRCSSACSSSCFKQELISCCKPHRLRLTLVIVVLQLRPQEHRVAVEVGHQLLRHLLQYVSSMQRPAIR